VITFGSEFVEDTDPRLKKGVPNIFPRDKDLDRKLMRWREAWLSLLVHIYETQYLVRGLAPVPQSVLDHSNKYKESFDMYGKFKAERMIDFRDPRQTLLETGEEQATVSEMKAAYTKWLKANEGILSGTKLTQQELQIRLEEDFGGVEAKVFKRVMVFNSPEEMQDEIEKRSSSEATLP